MQLPVRLTTRLSHSWEGERGGGGGGGGERRESERERGGGKEERVRDRESE